VKAFSVYRTYTEWRGSHPVVDCQALAERHWELVGEALPIVISHLVFEPVKDLQQRTAKMQKPSERYTNWS